MAWGTNTPPANWLIADGAAVSRSTYSSLFAVIGTQYGAGNGTTTFNLPDLRGRVPVGRNGGTFGTLAGTGGAETHSLTEAQMPGHTHAGTTTTEGTHNHAGSGSNMFVTNGGGAATANISTGGGGYALNTTTANAGAHSHTFTTAVTGNGGTLGNGQAHNNLQPYLVVNYIIKATAGWTAGDSELATRLGAVETEQATTNRSGLVPVTPTSVSVGSGTATVDATGTITFNGSTSVQANGVFTSGYRSYVQVVTFNTTASLEIRQVFTAGGTPQTSANYGWGGIAVNGGAPSYYSGSGIDWYALGATQAATSHAYTQEIHNPAVSGNITRTVFSGGFWNGGWASINFSGAFNNTAAVDGIRIYSTSANTVSGQMKIYGYR
jgi:microcystin-dependent protein